MAVLWHTCSQVTTFRVFNTVVFCSVKDLFINIFYIIPLSMWLTLKLILKCRCLFGMFIVVYSQELKYGSSLSVCQQDWIHRRPPTPRIMIDHNKEGNVDSCDNLTIQRDHYTKCNKPGLERQILQALTWQVLWQGESVGEECKGWENWGNVDWRALTFQLRGVSSRALIASGLQLVILYALYSWTCSVWFLSVLTTPGHRSCERVN